MRCQVVDSLPRPGGQLATLYPTRTVYDVAGFPELGTSRATRFSRAVVLAVGVGAFRPRPLPVAEAPRYHGKGVHYFIDDLARFRRKRVLVVGGGDSAVDYALMLEDVADEVTVVHRRAEFRAPEASVRRLLRSRVRVRTDAQVCAMYGHERVEAVRIGHNATNEVDEPTVDAIVSSLGFVAPLGPVATWGLAIEKGQVNSRMETSIPGVYAAGDCAGYPGKVRLVATGFGEAATAVNSAKAGLDPKAALAPAHSSGRERPAANPAAGTRPGADVAARSPVAAPRGATATARSAAGS